MCVFTIDILDPLAARMGKWKCWTYQMIYSTTILSSGLDPMSDLD
jgi:hypothetical protein